MATLSPLLRQLLFTALLLLPAASSFPQSPSLKETEKDLVAAATKVFPFYYGNYDSLTLYSHLFSDKLTKCITKNPGTLSYPFTLLRDSNACSIVTSPDGLFRIYSWDTWLGGTMHSFNNIYQYRSGKTVHVSGPGDEEGDFGTLYTAIYLLKANNKNYYLATSGGSESSKDAYEAIEVLSVESDTLNNKVALIKTGSGMHNAISFEYDFFSVADRKERPIRLIQYDADKKIIYIPVVLDDGKVTNRFIQYRFNGKYFERMAAPKNKTAGKKDF